MFIAVVQIPGVKRSREDAIKAATGSAPTYRELAPKGLLRKDYLNGEAGGGGVYYWTTREAAEAWYDAKWWVWMEERFGKKPILTFYETYVTVDNVAGETRVDGMPVAVG
jgi:hypothetical protein